MHVNPRIAALLQGLNNPSLPGIDLSLVRMQELLAALGHPEQHMPPVIHVAGTNGKGSTIAFMQAMLEAAGRRVHRYHSPHLVTFNERILLAGQPISDGELEEYLQQVSVIATSVPVTFFEATTAVAFLAFAQHQADILLLEVGMGGRLDATNLIPPPRACVITPIGLDHQEFLGADIAAIAAEKAGILKPGVPCIVGAQPLEAMQLIEVRAAELQAPLYRFGDEWHYEYDAQGVVLHWGDRTLVLGEPALAGAHQQHNAALAAMVLAVTGMADDAALAQGTAQALWPGRLQQITRGPLVEQWGRPFWIDGAHNAHASMALAAWAARQPQPVVMVCGLMARKDAAAFFAPLADVAAEIITVPIPGHSDAQHAAVLADQARGAGCRSHAAADMAAALTGLERYNSATLLVAGSLYLVGEILKNHE